MDLWINKNADEIYRFKIAENKYKTILLGGAAKKEEILFRVDLYKEQSIIAFPKFSSIAISFLVEDEDWNTNLPYKCKTEEIYNHIKCNKKYKEIKKKDCIKAIEMIQVACQVLDILIK